MYEITPLQTHGYFLSGGSWHFHCGACGQAYWTVMGGPRDDDLLFHHQHRQCFVDAFRSWSIFTVHHRCCCPLCDFLLPPLHDHRECRPLISGTQNVKNTGISSHYKISRCTFMVSLATWLGWALQWSKLCQTMCLPGDQKANNHIHRVRWATP